MFSNPESRRQRGRAKVPLRSALKACTALFALMLAACTTMPANKGDDDAVAKALAAQAAVPPAVVACPVPAPQAPETCVVSASNEAVARILTYADRVRLIPPADLGPEVARLGDVALPSSQLQLALLLAQFRQLPELIRAQEMLARVLGNASLDAQPLHPLARLLAARFSEQRRVEELLDKQNQQVRDVQRRLDQTNERLEALKAIERSLASRPAASAPSPSVPAAPAASAPASRVRPAAP